MRLRSGPFFNSIRAALLVLTGTGFAWADPPVFPQAEGFGVQTPGGRGGQIFVVSSLADSGPGTLREAIDATGPRIVVFAVSGDIVLERGLFITNPFITIAGQSAPGDGIQIRNDSEGSWAADSFPPITIHTHAVVIRYLRIRPGMPDFDPQCADIVPSSCWNDGETPTNPNQAWMDVCGQSPTPCIDPNDIDGIEIGNQAQNIVIDHVSIAWHTDEGIALGSSSDMTVQNSIIAEGLNFMMYDPTPASFDGKGMLVGHAASVSRGEITGRLSVHHNLFAHNSARAPAMNNYCFDPLVPSDCFSDVVNNVAYNWKNFGTNVNNFLGHHFSNIESNYYKRGPDRNTGGNAQNAITMNDWDFDSLDPGAELQFYFSGNRREERLGGSVVDAPIMCSLRNPAGPPAWTPCDANTYAVSRFPTPPVTSMAADAAYPTVLNDAGASRQLDGLGGWIWTRDETDQRIVDETLDGSGSIIFDHATFRARAWPVLTAGTAHPDTDADGMPDAWENSFGLDPLSDDAALDPDADVYTNLEEYLNATSPIVTETNACHASALSWGSSKSELTWQAPALFHCSSVFDVARGNVAQLRAAQGDFSGAACLENDTGSNSSIDPLEPPPNAANWYLVRVDGETWRTGAPAETGQRDTSLTICP